MSHNPRRIYRAHQSIGTSVMGLFVFTFVIGQNHLEYFSVYFPQYVLLAHKNK